MRKRGPREQDWRTQSKRNRTAYGFFKVRHTLTESILYTLYGRPAFGKVCLAWLPFAGVALADSAVLHSLLHRRGVEKVPRALEKNHAVSRVSLLPETPILPVPHPHVPALPLAGAKLESGGTLPAFRDMRRSSTSMVNW